MTGSLERPLPTLRSCYIRTEIWSLRMASNWTKFACMGEHAPTPPWILYMRYRYVYFGHTTFRHRLFIGSTTVSFAYSLNSKLGAIDSRALLATYYFRIRPCCVVRTPHHTTWKQLGTVTKVLLIPIAKASSECGKACMASACMLRAVVEVKELYVRFSAV